MFQIFWKFCNFFLCNIMDFMGEYTCTGSEMRARELSGFATGF